MLLCPKDIYFSQDSINDYFDSKCFHSSKKIGETLDDICEGRCSVSDIPTISVKLHDGKWVTADNRRLWVFRQLERLGKCASIQVRETWHLPEHKMTSYNGGDSIRVRRNPGGQWHRKPSNYKQPVRSFGRKDNFSQKISKSFLNEDQGNSSRKYTSQVHYPEKAKINQQSYIAQQSSNILPNQSISSTKKSKDDDAIRHSRRYMQQIQPSEERSYQQFHHRDKSQLNSSRRKSDTNACCCTIL